MITLRSPHRPEDGDEDGTDEKGEIDQSGKDDKDNGDDNNKDD